MALKHTSNFFFTLKRKRLNFKFLFVSLPMQGSTLLTLISEAVNKVLKCINLEHTHTQRLFYSEEKRFFFQVPFQVPTHTCNWSNKNSSSYWHSSMSVVMIIMIIHSWLCVMPNSWFVLAHIHIETAPSAVQLCHYFFNKNNPKEMRVSGRWWRWRRRSGGW